MDFKTFSESRFNKGSAISYDELQDLLSESNYRRAKERILYLLSYKSYSKKELLDKLKLEYDEEAISKAVSKVEDLGFINDELYAKNYASKLFNTKGFAEKRVRYELSRKGIEPDLIEKVISELDLNPKDRIINLLERKFKSKISNEKDINRTIASLQRLGYRFDDIKLALSEVLSEDSFS